MCGRVVQASPPDQLTLSIVEGRGEDDRARNTPPRFNGAPSQELWAIRRRADTGETSLDLLRWGLIPNGAAARPKPPPVNAAAEILTKRADFAEAYARRRCILPVDAFYEWRPVEGDGSKPGSKAKQPYAIAMADRAPFGLAALWENWRDPATGEWLRTFCVVTTRANSLLRPIHHRMPAILRPDDYGRWLDPEADVRGLLGPYPADAMIVWPVSTRVNSVRNDEPSLLDPHPDADACAPPDGNSA